MEEATITAVHSNYPSIHPFLFILIRAGANPRCHRSRGGVHPGQVESVTSQEKCVTESYEETPPNLILFQLWKVLILITVTVG